MQSAELRPFDAIWLSGRGRHAVICGTATASVSLTTTDDDRRRCSDAKTSTRLRTGRLEAQRPKERQAQRGSATPQQAWDEDEERGKDRVLTDRRGTLAQPAPMCAVPGPCRYAAACYRPCCLVQHGPGRRDAVRALAAYWLSVEGTEAQAAT